MIGALRYGSAVCLLLSACGGGDRPRGDGAADRAEGSDPSATAGEAPAPPASTARADLRDPVPVKVTAEVDGAKAAYSGLGECHHTADASIYEVPATMWSARVAGESGELRYLNLTLWQPKGAAELQVSLGLTVGDRSYDIATVTGAPVEGLGARGGRRPAARAARCRWRARMPVARPCGSRSTASGGPSRWPKAGEEDGPMTEAEAQDFAQEWIAAWNSHDLDRILRHYAEDVEVTSPLVEVVLGPGRVTIKGKPALREYWGAGLAKYPDLHFRLYRAYAGPRSVVLHYQSVQALVGAECLEFDAAGLVRRVLAHYALGPDPVAA